MKMLMIVSRSSLLPDLLGELEALGVTATTQLPEVHGVGAAGAALGAFPSPASNSVVLAALEDEQAEHVAAGVRVFHGRKIAQQRGGQVPLRVFILPCTQVV